MKSTFPKTERLCSKTFIADLFLNGNSLRSNCFTARYLRDHVDQPRTENPKLLISVPKRYQRRAVDRNRTKRLIREVYRKHKALYLSASNIHALAIVFSSSKVPNYKFVETHLVKILEIIK